MLKIAKLENGIKISNGQNYILLNEKILYWFTTKSKVHIPVFEGQTATEAMQKFIDKHKGKNYTQQEENKIKQLAEKSFLNEPEITKDITDITSQTGGKNVGLEFRKKTIGSITRKAKSDSLEKNVDIEKAYSELNDVIRYSYAKEADKLVEDGQKTLKALESKGYRVLKIKNTFLDNTNPYSGINVQMLSPKGQRFELQFNTLDNYRVKEKQHLLYEIKRFNETPDWLKKDLDKMMFDIAKDYQKVKGIEKFIKK